MKNIHELQKPTYDETLTEIAKEYKKAIDYVKHLNDITVDMENWEDAKILAFNLHSLVGSESWAYERRGTVHIWEEFYHARLLKKATQLMNEFPDMELHELVKMVTILKY